MRRMVPLLFVVLSTFALGQLDKIVIPAGTPEDQALSAIANEQDAQKKLAAYEDFVQKFSANPAAVAYGNWQIAQTYQTTGDLQKALEYGDKALAASPHNLDILVSQANIAQQLKDNAKLMGYATTGGQAYNALDKQAKPEGVTDNDFAARIDEDKSSARNAYEFLEAAGFNVIGDEKDPKKRMAYIEAFGSAFPKSRFESSLAQLTAYTLGPGQLNDPARLISYGEKTLASDPNNMNVLLFMADHYAEESSAGELTKSASYAQKVIDLAKADAPDADRSRKLSGGLAESTLGFVLMKQDKTLAAVGHLKNASDLLKGQDDVPYATALYRLGFAYAKLNKVSDARSVLNEAVKIPGPLQQPSQELLAKVNAARSKAKQ